MSLNMPAMHLGIATRRKTKHQEEYGDGDGNRDMVKQTEARKGNKYRSSYTQPV